MKLGLPMMEDTDSDETQSLDSFPFIESFSTVAISPIQHSEKLPSVPPISIESNHNTRFACTNCHAYLPDHLITQILAADDVHTDDTNDCCHPNSPDQQLCHLWSWPWSTI
jgi:hypothetical protein